MEQEKQMQSAPVELQLLGLDRKWVRSDNGQWVDKDSLNVTRTFETTDQQAEELFEEPVSNKRWWRFW